jgi:LysM repeat protein
MSLESSSIPTKLCPTCGTRVNDDATRCLVCGADLGSLNKPPKPSKAVQGSRMPEITVSLPVAIVLLAVFITLGAAMVFLAIRSRPEVVVQISPTVTETTTSTPTITVTEAPPTATSTPEPTPTPFVYTVVAGDSCSDIALRFQVSVNAIIMLNRLSANCDLSVGRELAIPQPTPTATPLPTSTLSVAQQTEMACEKVNHVVKDNETLSEIATAYNVPMQAIKDENGLPGDTVFIGNTLRIPLCMRAAPVGPTPTPTQPPPYQSPNLLLPADGAPFTVNDDSVTLQWASVGTLTENEFYVVTIEDITSGVGEKMVRYVSDTRFNLPASMRPNDRNPHIFYWSVATVRQIGVDRDGRPIYDTAGASSVKRTFSWYGSGTGPSPTP